MGNWYLHVLSLFYCSYRIFIAFMFHDLSLLAICSTVSFFVFVDVRSHLNKNYLGLLNYLLTYLLTICAFTAVVKIKIF